MATLTFTNLDILTAPSILTGNGLVYTPLGLNVTARKFDADGNATDDVADTEELLIGYNTTTVPPLDPLNLLSGVNLADILLKNGNSNTDSLRATNGNDIVYWDYATLFSLSTLSVPVGIAVLSRYNLPATNQTAAIEIFDMGGGDDILNLTHSNSQFLLSGLLVDPMAYGYAATAFGGAGNDVLWSGNLNDTLYGETGDDWIDGGDGNDTIFGGDGWDTLEGGLGNDIIIDLLNASMIRGGGGNDVIALQLNDANVDLLPSSTDNYDATDGNDKVVISGDYASAEFELGGGNDVYIALASTAPSVDRVFAGDGADAVSTWTGNDVVNGEEGDDVIWGGAGGDTIAGGDGHDLLYDGSGLDTVFGGAGRDLLYFGREGGIGNEFYDLEREGLTPDGNDNAILVFGAFAYEANGDGFDDARGVYELDGNIMDNEGGDDMVYVSQVDGNIYRLEILEGGVVTASVDFDVRDVDYIGLWDNAGVSGQYQQQYRWDDASDSYVRLL